MKCNYSVYYDGERRPSVKSCGELAKVLADYVESAQHNEITSKVARGVQVAHVNRRRGVKIVLTHAIKRTKIEGRESKGFLRIKLDGIQTMPQIKVAVADKLKSSEGWHRTVVLVEANGLEYKVKCNHKGLTYTECVHKCEIVGRKIL